MVSYKLLFLFQTSRLQILLEIYLREIEVNWKLEGWRFWKVVVMDFWSQV